MLPSGLAVRQTHMRIFWLGMTLASLLLLPAAADISGKWSFSVELENGGHEDPTFVLEQKEGKITGTYNGPLGEQKVTGTVKDDTAEFGFTFERDGESAKVTYTAKIEALLRCRARLNLRPPPRV